LTTEEISRVMRCREPGDSDIDVVMLEHVSPIEWDNAILCGQYVLDHDQVRAESGEKKEGDS
jgi:hypothetical protein